MSAHPSPVDNLDAATTVPNDCTEVFDNHGELNATGDQSPFLASQVDFVPSEELCVGMVTPVFDTSAAMSADWSSAEWIASYQVYGITAHSVFLQRVLKKKQTGLPQQNSSWPSCAQPTWPSLHQHVRGFTVLASQLGQAVASVCLPASQKSEYQASGNLQPGPGPKLGHSRPSASV